MLHGAPHFETTLWSQVRLAAREPNSSDGRRALERLCGSYWFPIYAFIRRQSATSEDAQDLTQGFFEHILSKRFLENADPGRGRFRSYLLGAVRNYLGNERDKRLAQRRGGWVERIPIDASLAEHWLSIEPSVNDAARAFDRSWANALISHSLAALEQEQKTAGRAEIFRELKEFLQRPAIPGEYDRVAGKLRMTKGAVAATVHRLNERFGELVRRSVRDTVVKPEMAEDELRFLFSALQN